jgi:hypothetical protein
MRWFRRNPPAWADGLTAEEIDELKAALTASVGADKTIEWDTWSDGAVVRGSDELEQRIAFHRIASMYQSTPKSERHELLMRHFRLAGRVGLDELPEDWEEARSLLVAKIYNAGSFEAETLRDFVMRDFAPGMTAMLQVETPDTFQGVTRAAADQWQVDEAELWRTAARRVHETVPATDESQEVSDGCFVRVMHNQHRLVVSHILELESHLAGGNHGVIVGVPHENLFHFHEIRDRAADAALGYIMLATADMFNGSPATGISPHTYWWRDGNFSRLTAWDADNRLRFRPDPEFNSLMRALTST